MRVAITGGAGFIGSNLAKRLSAQGHEIAILDDFSTGLLSNLEGANVDLFEGSVTDPRDVRTFVKGAECIVHLAARGSVPRSIADPVATHQVNLVGTANVLECVRETGAHLIFSSSSSVYGLNPELPRREDQWLQPISPYAASKLASEAYVSAYSASYGLSALIFRFFNVFGPGQRPDHEYAAVIPRWILRAMRGETVLVNGSGRISRDFTSIREVVNVLESSIVNRVSHARPVNLALGRNISLNDVLTEIRRHFPNLRDMTGPARPGDIESSTNDPRVFVSLFPRVAQQDFADAIDETVQWLRAQEARGLLAD